MAPRACRREVTCGCGKFCAVPCQVWVNKMWDLVTTRTNLLRAETRGEIQKQVARLRAIMVRGRVTLLDLVRLTLGGLGQEECLRLCAFSLSEILKNKYWKLARGDSVRIEILRVGQQVDSVVSNYAAQFQEELAAAGLPDQEMILATNAAASCGFYTFGEELVDTAPCPECGVAVVPGQTVRVHRDTVGPELCPSVSYQIQRALDADDERQQQRRPSGRGRARGQPAVARSPSPRPGGPNYSVIRVSDGVVTCRVRGGVATDLI